MMSSTRLIIARKEMVDHLRDTRSLTSAAAYALMGPVVVLLVSLSPKGQGPSMPLVVVGMLSVFALVSAFAGGTTVATDVMAGERERRSLLPLLTTPIAWRDVIIGKWIAASAFAVGSTGLNLAGVVLVLAIRAPGTLITQAPTLAVWAVFGLVPLALFGAALQIRVAGAARSMKEAATSLTLLTFVPMMVGMFLVFFPVTAGRWALVPIVGQQIVIDAGMRGAPAPLLQVVMLAAVTIACTAVPLLTAGRALGRDDVAR